MEEEKEYFIDDTCYGCKAESSLRHVHVYGVDYTMCYVCEQKIVGAILSGKL